jgi:hypothetical protein
MRPWVIVNATTAAGRPPSVTTRPAEPFTIAVWGAQIRLACKIRVRSTRFLRGWSMRPKGRLGWTTLAAGRGQTELTTLTSRACGPFGPSSTSYSTFALPASRCVADKRSGDNGEKAPWIIRLGQRENPRFTGAFKADDGTRTHDLLHGNSPTASQSDAATSHLSRTECGIVKL